MINPLILPEKPNDLNKGILLIVIAFLCIAIMSTFGKAAADELCATTPKGKPSAK